MTLLHLPLISGDPSECLDHADKCHEAAMKIYCPETCGSAQRDQLPNCKCFSFHVDLDPGISLFLLHFMIVAVQMSQTVSRLLTSKLMTSAIVPFPNIRPLFIFMISFLSAGEEQETLHKRKAEFFVSLSDREESDFVPFH